MESLLFLLWGRLAADSSTAAARFVNAAARFVNAAARFVNAADSSTAAARFVNAAARFVSFASIDRRSFVSSHHAAVASFVADHFVCARRLARRSARRSARHNARAADAQSRRQRCYREGCPRGWRGWRGVQAALCGHEW